MKDVCLFIYRHEKLNTPTKKLKLDKIKSNKMAYKFTSRKAL